MLCPTLAIPVRAQAIKQSLYSGRGLGKGDCRGLLLRADPSPKPSPEGEGAGICSCEGSSKNLFHLPPERW